MIFVGWLCLRARKVRTDTSQSTVYTAGEFGELADWADRALTWRIYCDSGAEVSTDGSGSSDSSFGSGDDLPRSRGSGSSDSSFGSGDDFRPSPTLGHGADFNGRFRLIGQQVWLNGRFRLIGGAGLALEMISARAPLRVPI